MSVAKRKNKSNDSQSKIWSKRQKKTHFCNKNINNSKQFSKKALLQQHHKKPQKKQKFSKIPKKLPTFQKNVSIFSIEIKFQFCF